LTLADQRNRSADVCRADLFFWVSAAFELLVFPAFAFADPPHRIDIWTYLGPSRHFNQVVFQSIEKRRPDNPFYNSYVAGVTHEKHGFQFLPHASKRPDVYIGQNPILELESAYRDVSCNKFLEIRHDYPFKEKFLKNYLDYENFVKERNADSLSAEQLTLVEYYENDPTEVAEDTSALAKWWTKTSKSSAPEMKNNNSALWIVSGQTVRGGRLQFRPLPLEISKTMFPDPKLDRNLFKYVWEIDRAIQTPKDKIPDILSAATTLMAIQLRQAKGNVNEAYVFAHSRSEPRTREFKFNYGMQIYRRSTVIPGNTILFAPLTQLLDRFMTRSPFKLLNQLQEISPDVSKNIGLLFDLSDLKSTYLDMKSEVDKLPNQVVQLRDFSNGFELIKKSLLKEYGFESADRLSDTDLDRFLFTYAYESRDARMQLKGEPDNGHSIKPLYRFLRDESAIEVIAADQVKPIAVLIGTYFYYLSRLTMLGIESSEQLPRSRETKIAMTTFSPAQAVQLAEMSPSKVRTYAKKSLDDSSSKSWLVIGNLKEVRDAKVFVGTYVFTMEQIREMIAAHPEYNNYKGVLFEGPLHDEYRISHGGWFNL
jgi:hypothetical protein